MRHKGINNTHINSARRILKQAYYVWVYVIDFNDNAAVTCPLTVATDEIQPEFSLCINKGALTTYAPLFVAILHKN